MNVRVAAHIAYALHNEAEAAYSNADFQLDCATQKLAAIDQILGVSDGAALLSRFDVEDKINPDDARPRSPLLAETSLMTLHQLHGLALGS
ncbi:hypothetical protein EC919_11817 [Pseudomonas graminis]|nr:hypothetical protein EC919_11817 [Pseudomonas graminis]